MTKVHIIAEAGSNHNGREDWASALIDIAAECNATSVKFQFIYPEGLYVPKYVSGDVLEENPVYAQRANEVLGDDVWERLAAHSAERNLPMAASVFDRRGIKLAQRLGFPYLKIASTDLNNVGLISAVADTGMKLIISTGMSTLGEVEEAVEIVRKAGAMERLVLLHCVSLYPCPVKSANLPFLSTLRAAFGVEVGFSDHTQGSIASCAAVALGATYLEKHFSADKNAPGFDHLHAADPAELARYVADVRETEGALQVAEPKVGPSEANTRLRARRSLYAARDLKAGEVVTEADVLVVRPSGSLAPRDLPMVVGQTVAQPIKAYEALSVSGGVVASRDVRWKAAAEHWQREMAEKKMVSRAQT